MLQVLYDSILRQGETIAQLNSMQQQIAQGQGDLLDKNQQLMALHHQYQDLQQQQASYLHTVAERLKMLEEAQLQDRSQLQALYELYTDEVRDLRRQLNELKNGQ